MSRGITQNFRQLAQDMIDLLPNTKVESKLERKESRQIINDLCYERSCNNFLYFVRAFQACVTGVSEAAPSDGLIEYSWTFQSRGEIYVGTLNNSTSALDVYA